MSSCTFPYIEKAFRNNDPSQADYLNGLHISAWKQVKESNLFDLDESGYKFNVEDVEEKLKQDEFVNLLNTDFKGEVVTNQNNYVAVNLTPIFPDNNIKSNNINYDSNNLQEGLQWLKKIMPDVEPVLVNGLINNIANGSYDILNDLITLSEDFANKKVVKEEAFHRVFNLLPKSEQEKLLNEGSKKYNIKRDKSTATIKYSLADQNKVDFGLKAIEILESDKAKQVFEKGEKNKWDLNKILSELAIPKEQKQLILDLGKTNREEIITDLLANYSYTIEINTVKKEKSDFSRFVEEGDNPWEQEQQEEIGNIGEPTQYYSNLTVPGGTNYTEQEIATPAITPSIKGHAQFASDKGIGWFRSDEQGKTDTKKPMFWVMLNDISQSEFFTKKEAEDFIILHSSKRGGDTSKYSIKETKSEIFNEGTRTRRILEVQSDLFQKGRNAKELVRNDDFFDKNKPSNTFLNPDDFDSHEEFLEANSNFQDNNQRENNGSENQFLQLLNKDNNWVTFFIKSIIQDSAKKGYEKVLFPTGDTASKVEGHTTLEEFKKQKEDRIKELEKQKLEGYNEIVEEDLSFLPDPDLEGLVPSKTINIDNEINQLKQELERIEKEGFGALKPIYNFYENTVTNILNKQYGKDNVKQITDEYGNTWNEITITPKMSETIRLNTPNGKIEYTGDLAIEEKIAEEAFNSKDEKIPTTLIDKFIQSIKNLFRNIFKEKDNISRLIRDLNQGQFKNQLVQQTNNNLTPIFPDNNNIELGNISYNREKLGRFPNISKQLSATNDFNRALIQYVEETYLMGRPTYKKTDSGNYIILQKSDKLRNTRNPFIASLNVAKSLKKSIEKAIPGMKIEVVDSTTGYHYIKIKPSKELIQTYENIFRINNLFPDLPSAYSKDPLVRSKYFRDSDTITDKEILTKISKSNHPLANLAKHLIKYTSGIPINLVPEIPILDSREGEISGRYYNNSGNEYIEIAEFATFKGRGSEPTIIHEVLHSLTAKWLREVNKESELYKEFDKYYKETIQNVGEYIENKTAEELGRNNFYAVKNLDEFIVALFTDGQFIKTLKNIPASEPTKFENRFQELFNFLLSLFGIKQNSSLYSEAFAVASNIIEEQFELDNTLLDFTDPYRDDFFDNYDLIDSYDVSLDNYYYDPSKNISNVDVKPGVQELFNSNPELAFIGTAEKYSAYLDSIFPDSKVKDIVYHSRFNVGNIKNKDRWRNGFYSGTKEQADLMADMAESSSDLMTTSALLINMQNPKVTDYTDRNVEDYKNTNDGFIIKATEKDALQLIGDRDGYNVENFKKEYVVFEPEQIHILGNKQDIEGFKEFVKNDNESKSLQKDFTFNLIPNSIEEQFKEANSLKNKTPENNEEFNKKILYSLILPDISYNRFLKVFSQTDQKEFDSYRQEKVNTIINNFVKKFGITVETISKYQDRYAIANNKTISYNGVANLANKTIKYLEGDTNALTEEVAHFMVAMLGSDSEQYLALKNYIKQTPEYEIYYDTYFEVYNDVDKTEEEIMGKVLANALLGKKEQVPLSLKSIIKQIFNRIKSFITPQYKREFNKAVDNITHLFFTENFDTAFNEANINFNEFYQLDLNFQQQSVFEKSSDQIIDTILTNLQRQKAKFIQNKQTDLVYKINDLIEILKDTEGDIDNSERIKNFISFSVLEIEEIKRSLKNFEESGVIQELQNRDFSKLTREQQEAYTQEQRLHTLNYISSAISTVQNLNSFITLIDENFNSFNKDLKSLFDFKELINNLDDTPANNALKEILKFTQSDTKNSKLEEIRSVYNKISQDLLTVVFNALSTEEQKSFLKNIKTNPISKSANQNDVKTVTGIFNTIKDYSLGKYSISSIYNSFRTNLMPLSFQKDIFLVSIDNANAAIRQIKLMETTAEVYEMDLLHTDLQVLGEFDQNFVSAKDEKGKPNFKLLQKYNFSKFKTSLASKILNKDLIPFINKNLDVFKKQLDPKDLQILLNSLNSKINNTKELEILLSKLFENGNLNKKLYYFLKNYIKAKELIYTLSLSKVNDNLSDIDYNTLNQYQNEYIQQLQFKLDNLDFTDDNLPYLNINFDFTKASVSESDLQNVVLNIIKLRRDKIISEEVTIPEQINGVPNPVYYNQLGYAEGLLNFFKQKINFSEDSSGNVNLNYINFLTLGDDLFFNLTDTNNIEGIDYVDQDYLKLENDAKNSSNTRTQKLAETKLKIIKKIQDYNDKHNLKSNHLKKKLKYNNSQYLSNNSNYRGFLNLLFRRVLPAAITLGVSSNLLYAPVIYYTAQIGIDQLVKIAYFVRSNGYNWDSVKKAIRLYFNSNYKDELRVDETTLNNSDSEQVKLTNIFSKLFEAVKNKVNKKQLNNVDTDSEVIDTNTFLVGEAELPKPFSDPGLDNTQLSYDFISDFKTFTQEMANYETNVRWESWIRMVGDYMSKRDDTSGIGVINTIKDRYFFNKFYSPDRFTTAIRLITGWFAKKVLVGNVRSQIINFTLGSFTTLIHSDPITFTKAFISTLKDSSIKLNTAIDGKTILNDFINMFTGSNSEKSRLAFFQTLADVFILGKNPSLINQRNDLNSHIKRYLKNQRGTGFTMFNESEDYLTSLTQSTGDQGLQQLVENFITSNLINVYLLNNPLYTENNEPILNLKNYLYIENGKIKLDTKKLGKEKIYLKDAKKSQELNFENVDIAQDFSNLTFEQLGVKPLTDVELEIFLNETMLNEISNLQEKSQGVYSIFNKAHWRNKSIGLLLLQFKDYILPAQTAVINSKKISSDLKDYEKGIFNTISYLLTRRFNFSNKKSYDLEQNVLLLQSLDYKTMARDNAILKFLFRKLLTTDIDKSLKEIASDNKKYRESVKKQTSFNILNGVSRIEYIQLFSNKPDSEIYENIQKTFLTQDSKKIQLIKKLIDTKFKTSPPSSFDESDLKDLEDLDVKENYAEVIKSYALLENELSGDIKAASRFTNMLVSYGGLFLAGLLFLLFKGIDDEDKEEKGTKGYTIWDYLSVERENIVSNLVANFLPFLESEAFGLKDNKWDYTKGLLSIGDYYRIISKLDLDWASDDNVRTSTKKIKERELIAKLTKGNLPLFKPLIKRDKNGNYYLENNIDLKENILKLMIPKGIADNFELFENKRDKERYEQMKNLNFIQLLTLMAKNNKFAKFGGIYIDPEEQEKRDKQLEASNERIKRYEQDQEEEEENSEE
jgi:hypothetical protein